MNLKRKNIVIGIVIILLAAGYYFVKNYEPPEKDKETVTEDNRVVLFEAGINDIERISVKNSTGEYTLIKNESWSVEGKDYIELNDTSFVYMFSRITAADVIEKNAADLSNYGLDTPEAEICVSAAEKGLNLLIGSGDPTGNYYYASEKGGNTIYIITKYSAEPFFRGLNSLRSMVVTDINITDVRGIEIKSGDRELEISYSPLPEGTANDYGVVSVWKIEKPLIVNAANDKVIENVITPAISLVADDIAEDNPKDLAKYGLDKKIIITTEQGDITYFAGNANGKNYVYTENGISVYVIDAESLKFLDTKPEDIMQSFIAIYNIEDVRCVSYMFDGTSGTLEKGDGNYSVNGAYVSREEYTGLYQKFIGLTADGIAYEPYNSSEKIGEISYKFNDGNTDTVMFYGYDELNYAAVSGGNTFIIKKTKLDELKGEI